MNESVTNGSLNGPLDGQVALVTGASRGIGKAIAETLARRGAVVVGTATSDSGAEAISNALRHGGLNGAGRVLDVNDAAAVDALVKSITSEFGTPMILVNNAAVTRDQLLMRMKEEDWDIIIDTNLRSVYRLSKACLRGMMKSRQGRIISVSSVVGLTGSPGQTNYSAAKAGIIGFSKSLAREVGSRGITVNVVAPGFVETDMTRDLPEEQRSYLLNQVPLQRAGKPADVATAVAFLASTEAAYITGETLHVNGGMYMS